MLIIKLKLKEKRIKNFSKFFLILGKNFWPPKKIFLNFFFEKFFGKFFGKFHWKILWKISLKFSLKIQSIELEGDNLEFSKNRKKLKKFEKNQKKSNFHFSIFLFFSIFFKKSFCHVVPLGETIILRPKPEVFSLKSRYDFLFVTL